MELEPKVMGSFLLRLMPLGVKVLLAKTRSLKVYRKEGRYGRSKK